MKNVIYTWKLACRLAVIFLLTSHDNLYATEQYAQHHCLAMINYNKRNKVTADSDFLENLQLLIESTDQVTKGKRGTVYQQLGFEPNNKDIAFILSVRWAYVKGCQQAGSSQSVEEPADAQTHLMTVMTYATKKQKEGLLSHKDKLGSTLLHVIQADEITAGKGGRFYQELGFVPSKTKELPFLSALQWAYRKGVNISVDLDDTQQELFRSIENKEEGSSVDEPQGLLNNVDNMESSTSTLWQMSPTESGNAIKLPINRHHTAHRRSSNRPKQRANRQTTTHSKPSKRAKPSSESSNEGAATHHPQGRDWLPLFVVIGGALALTTKIGHSLYHTYINGQRPVGRIKMQKKLRTE